MARKYETPLRSDLLAMGLRLETCDLSWENMWALLYAARPDSAIFYEKNEGWLLSDHLQAGMLERLNDLVWTKTKDAQRKPPRNRPKRIPRPGVESDDNRKLNRRPEGVEEDAAPTTIEEWLQRKEVERGGTGNRMGHSPPRHVEDLGSPQQELPRN